MARKKSNPPSSDESPKPRSSARSKSKIKPPETVGTSGSTTPGEPLGSKPRAPSRSTRKSVKEPPDEQPKLAQARLLANQAGESLDPKRRLSLAKQSVETSSDCAEGFLILADMAKTRKQALEFYKQAVDAAARVLGPDVFRDHAGSFWGIFETRLYMRARLALAEALWASSRRAEATDHLHEMLKLNPLDNQGLRYIQAAWLLFLDRLDELESLLGKFEEVSTTWAYIKALVAFRRTGDSAEARKLLNAAKRINKYVPSYLLGQKPLPPEQPPYYSPGDENDAIIYVGYHLAAWKGVPGALGWVRSRLKPTSKRRRKVSSVVGPSPIAEERLSRLPNEVDVWQGIS
jgi:tetratricopeptide (TPR) repeat protein